VASLARVAQARAAASAAGAKLAPSADFSVQASAVRQSLETPIGAIGQGFGYPRDARIYDVGATASWELDLFGGLRRGAQAARAEAQAAEAERLGTRISVCAESADAYFRVRGDQARITVAGEQIQVESRLVDLVRQRRARGVSSEREVAQAEALLKQAQTVLPLLNIDLGAQLNRLDVLMGVQPGTYAKELKTSREIPTIPGIPDNDQPLDVLRRRPDIIAAERRVAAANARIGVALSDYYPKISLSGVLGFESLSSSHLFSAEAFQPIALRCCAVALIRLRSGERGSRCGSRSRRRSACALPVVGPSGGRGCRKRVPRVGPDRAANSRIKGRGRLVDSSARSFTAILRVGCNSADRCP